MSGVTTAVAIGSLALGAIGAGVSAYGSIQAGQAKSAADQYQAQVAANNAKIADNNAAYAQEAGTVKEQQERQKTAAEVGAQLAGQASSGLDVDSGSAVNVRSGTSVIGEEDALTIRNDTARNVLAYKDQSAEELDQAQLDQFSSSNDSMAGYLSGAGSIIGGASSVGNMYVGDASKGIFTSKPPSGGATI